MKFDKNKVVEGKVYHLKDNYIQLANGQVGIATEGITSLPNISPYKECGQSDTKIPYTYDDHKNAIDLRAAVGTDVVALKDLTIDAQGTDNYGNYVTIDGFRFRHMEKLPTETSYKKGEVVFESGCNATNQPHLHVGNDAVDCFANAIEGKVASSSSTPPPTSTPKEYVEAKRSGKDSYKGTFKFDMKYYEELKDLCNQKDIYDLDEEKWLAGTTWTSVKKVGSSSSSTPTYTKVKVTRSGKSTDNGTFYFPLSAWEDIKDLKIAKDTKDINGVTWKKDTTFNSATRV